MVRVRREAREWGRWGRSEGVAEGMPYVLTDDVVMVVMVLVLLLLFVVMVILS